jgi:hypothetical protein
MRQFARGGGGGWTAFGTWPTIDCEEQWPFDFAPLEAPFETQGEQGKQGKRVALRLRSGQAG